MLAYVGLGPGQEFIPYFLAMLGLIGGALLAILQWPLTVLFCLFRRTKGDAKSSPLTSPTTEMPELVGESSPKNA